MIDALAAQLLDLSNDDPILTNAGRISYENLIHVLEICLREDEIARLQRSERLARGIA